MFVTVYVFTYPCLGSCLSVHSCVHVCVYTQVHAHICVCVCACHRSPSCQLMTSLGVAIMHVCKATTLLVQYTLLSHSSYCEVCCGSLPEFLLFAFMMQKAFEVEKIPYLFSFGCASFKKEGSIFGAELHFCLHSQSFLTFC